MVNVLSIHLGHHGSISISKGNELIVHTEISRYNKFKYASWPAYSLIKKINELNLIFDVVILNRMQNDSLPQWKNIFQRRLISVSKNCNFIECDDHHDFHQSCSALFNNSKNTIVWDSSGKKFVHSNIVSYENFSLYENNNLKYKECWTPEKLTMQHKNINISNNNVSLADAYSCFCNELGLLEKDPFSEGKAMAFSQFGVNKKKYSFCSSDNFKNKYVYSSGGHYMTDLETYRINKWLTLEKDNFEESANYACEFQENFQELSLKKLNTLKVEGSVTVTGGSAQNILTNSYLAYHYDLKVDPICNDQGISLGSLNTYFQNNLQMEKTLYLGFEPEYNINIFDNRFTIKSCDIKNICTILNEEPVALFQGRSEQGQRALGNRSLLMNATHPKCIEKINKIKKREWYRTFACTILQNKFEDYFCGNSTDPSYMMFVYKSKKDEILKNVINPKGYSRVQTVNEKQNKHYYDLIKCFNEIYKIPFVLNTSLNKPGSVITEDLEDVKDMMLTTNLKYLYLPELNKLVIHDKNSI